MFKITHIVRLIQYGNKNKLNSVRTENKGVNIMKKFIVMTLLIVVAQISCGGKAVDAKQAKQAKPAPFSGTVLTVKSGGGYTYLEIKGESGNYWAATRPIEAKTGDSVQLIHPMKMVKFHVKSLDRTFDIIYFADDVLVNGKSKATAASNPMGMGMSSMTSNPHTTEATQKMANPHQKGNGHMNGDKDFDASGVKPQNGSISIGELFKNPEKYSGKVVKVHALVTKYLPMIMKKNWLHLADASSGSGHLVATTDAEFKVGDTVMLSGKVELNKDFGYGYKYAVLLTEAKAGK